MRHQTTTHERRAATAHDDLAATGPSVHGMMTTAGDQVPIARESDDPVDTEA
jgi:hypothetical protein|tara:strand:- start:256 stop:411 length:156 start_codon:yes stop_codon:yes gene_type:complete